MPIGSYMLFIGLLSFLRLAVRDKQLYSDLTEKIENEYSSLRNLILSEKKDMTFKMTKPLVDFSIQWQRTHSHEELSLQEVRDIIDDIILELKKKKKIA
jgi:hypothetical protein